MWYEKEAKTPVDIAHQPRPADPRCQCPSCIAIREELPAQKIERKLRGILLDLDGMNPEELECVRIHLQDLRKVSPNETRKDDFRSGLLSTLEMYIWTELHADR